MEDQISLLEKKCSLLRVKNKQRNKKSLQWQQSGITPLSSVS